MSYDDAFQLKFLISIRSYSQIMFFLDLFYFRLSVLRKKKYFSHLFSILNSM